MFSMHAVARPHLFFSYTLGVRVLLFAVVSDRVNLSRNTASKNHDRNEDWKGRVHEMHMLGGIYVRSLLNTTDTRFSNAAQSVNVIHQNLPNNKICTIRYHRVFNFFFRILNRYFQTHTNIATVLFRRKNIGICMLEDISSRLVNISISWFTCTVVYARYKAIATL